MSEANNMHNENSKLESQHAASSEELFDENETALANDGKMVPLAESIRYRKRAQLAEKALEEAKGQLEKTSSDKNVLDGSLKKKTLENEILLALGKAGVKDIEAGLALVRSRLEVQEEASVGSVVEELKSEKSYLFSTAIGSFSSKTNPAKVPVPEGEKALTDAANKAAASGSRRDIQEYLRLKRNFK